MAVFIFTVPFCEVDLGSNVLGLAFVGLNVSQVHMWGGGSACLAALMEGKPLPLELTSLCGPCKPIGHSTSMRAHYWPRSHAQLPYAPYDA
eukprot:1142382-Pelagomonas_calceolata.AAC.5